MRKTIVFVTVIVVLFLIAGCSIGVQDGDQMSQLTGTAGSTVPEGTVPAVIFEIDGRRVQPGVSEFALQPGSHVVRVLPARFAPERPSAVPDLDPERAGKRLVPLTIDMRAGESYRIAARTVRFRTGILAGDTGPAEHSPWRVAVIPVVVDGRSAAQPPGTGESGG